jgi:hypothetical protein
MVIRIHSACGAADTTDQGETLLKVLTEALRKRDEITISFADIDTATSSFVNASLVQLLPGILSFNDLKRRVKIIDSTRQINEMIKRCVACEAENAKGALQT